jgi:hypothetical protein
MDFAYPLIGDQVALEFELIAFRVGDAAADKAAQGRSVLRPAPRPEGP